VWMPRSPLNPVEGQGVRRLRLEFRLMRKPLVPLSGRTLQPKDLTRVLHRPVELAGLASPRRFREGEIGKRLMLWLVVDRQARGRSLE